ncbi:LPS-assembly protein LptD [Paracoccus sp. MC1862]|uniref:LPS-assembly protein LptD n=2 Tax=Paracoccus sp. MC1862 TaxID=2760307 RepID=UPI001601DD2C|nr:LPS assembly protein LptD [Paracoccus sp. MC1862]MBB1497282.1 LPS-assembly protein LptD [Paracoccus sp. MC1862]QQO44751.1 LPS-assembly protein LptD [Paracoccus sp. MC1862]
MMTAPARILRRGTAALAIGLALATAASAQTDLTAPSVPFVGRGGPALAPTESNRRGDRLADGTSFTALPVVIAPRRPPARVETPPEPDDAATLLADHVDLSGDRVLTASGGVVIWFRGARLIAERVIYDGNAGTLAIEGPIHLTEPGSESTQSEVILIADAAQLDEDLQDGLLTGARMVLARELQFAAAEVRRTGQGRMTTLTHVVASSCQVCASDPTPLWEIRARRITHDAETRRIHFDRPQFRAFGLPVATLPVLSAPDPTVERMTGFLAPRFRTTSGLGFGVMLPYFITLGDSADLTLTPYVSASRTSTLGLRYRQAFVNGAAEINGAISDDDLASGTRGYLFANAAFRLPRDYLLGLQLQTASDRAYLLDYDITDADRLWSGVTLDRVARDRLVTARVGRYEALRDEEDNAAFPDLVADALWERRFRPALIGGEGGVQLSVHAHRRRSGEDIEGRDMARGSARLDWQRNEILPLGIVAAMQGRLDADLYRIRDDSRFDATEARATPVGAIELRWPLLSRGGPAANLLEPVLQAVWSPELDNEDEVPNEDSRLIEFDEGNLFSLDRLPGRDAVEGGLRANLGLTWTRIDPAGWSLGVTAGRVLRNDPDPAFERGGEVLSGRQSDWLLSATYSDSSGLAVANRALFDSDLSIHRDELRVGWLRPGLELSAGYLWIDARTEEGRPRDVSELTATTGWQVAQGWRATAETRYDFAADRAQKAELGLEYRNECVTVDLSVSRRFTSSDTVRADTDVGLSVRLGGFGRSRADGVATVARRSCLR